MGLRGDFVVLLKSIAGYIGKNEFIAIMMFARVSELATQMELDQIEDGVDPMLALLYLLMRKGIISMNNLEKLEEIAEVLEPGIQSKVKEEISNFKVKSCRLEIKPSSSDSMDTLEDQAVILPQQETVDDIDTQCDAFDCQTCRKNLPDHFEARCPGTPSLPNRMSRHDKQFLEGRMLEESKGLATKYSLLLDTTCASLRKNGISVEQAVMSMMTIATFLKPCFKKIPLFSAKIEDLASSKSFEKLFIAIHGYHSWFNIYPLRHLISVIGTQSDRVRLEDYERELSEYMGHRIFKSPQPIYGTIDTATCMPFVVKLDSSWDDTTIHSLVDVKDRIARILEVEPQVLIWQSIDEGCVKLTFSVPMFAGSRIVPLTQQQVTLLFMEGVIGLECGDYEMHRNGEEGCEGIRYSRGIDCPRDPSHCRAFKKIARH